MSTTHLSASMPTRRDGTGPLCLRLTGGDPALIELWGELGADTGHLLTELVEHVLRQEPATVLLDLAHARATSADGVRVLGLAQAMIVAAGARVSLLGAGQQRGTVSRTSRAGRLAANIPESEQSHVQCHGGDCDP